MSDNRFAGHDKPTDAFGEHIPPHDCPGDETCQYPAGFIMMIVKNPDDPDENAFLKMSSIHNVEATKIASALVDFVDQAFQDNRGDTPAIIAYGQGRSLMRDAIEHVTPPGEVLRAAGDFMDNVDWDLS